MSILSEHIADIQLFNQLECLRCLNDPHYFYLNYFLVDGLPPKKMPKEEFDYWWNLGLKLSRPIIHKRR